MARIRIKDKDPNSPRRRATLWQCLGKAKINPKGIRDTNAAFYVIAEDEMIEKLMAQDCRNIFNQNKFEIQDPPEYNAMRTVVIKKVDRQIAEYDREEIKTSIERENSWAKIDEVVKLPNTDTIIKIRFQTTQMAKKATDSGLFILFQSIPPETIEKEFFFSLIPCYRCYEYNHIIKDCPRSEQYKVCSECAAEGHTFRNCSETNKKCLNCNEDHRTLAARCPKRKQILKEKEKQERATARNRSATRTSHPQQQSYAGMAASSNRPAGAGSANDARTFYPENLFNSLPPNAAATIMSAILYAYTREAAEPGTFQAVMDDMYTLNNIPKVIFPSDVNASSVIGTMGNIKHNTNTSTGNQREEEMEQEEGSSKRGRETTPTEEITPKAKKTQGKKKQSVQHEENQSEEEYRMPPPVYHQNKKETRIRPERRSSVSSVSGASNISSVSQVQTRRRLPEMKLKASENSIGHIPKGASHLQIMKLINSKIIKYTYYHPDIHEDEVVREMIKEKTVDISAYKIHYIKEEAFRRINSGTRDQQTARKSSTDPDIL